MANDYYDMTGTLRLKHQTGVIDALFGGLRLESEPAGAISFRCMSEEDTMSWDAIFEALEDLASNLNINAPFGSSTTDDPKGDLLWALAAHFNASQNEELASLIDAGGFDDDASLDALFVLAVHPHNLSTSARPLRQHCAVPTTTKPPSCCVSTWAKSWQASPIPD